MAKTSTKELIDINLSKRELAELNALADNDTACMALKKVILSGVYFNGTMRPDQDAYPLFNFLLSYVPADGQRDNAQVGADVKAALEGIRLVEQGFSVLEQYKTKKKENKPVANPGR